MTERRSTRRVEEPEDRAKESVLGAPLVSRVSGLLRAMRMYEPSNQAIRNQLRDALVVLDEVMHDEVTLVLKAGTFHVNGVQAHAEGTQLPLFSALATEFERRGLGGVRFLEGLQAEELGAFLQLMAAPLDAAAGAKLGEAAVAAGLVHVSPITLQELATAELADGVATDPAPAGERAGARRTLRNAVVGARAMLHRTEETGRPAIRGAKRVVQPIVDAIMRNDYSIVALTAIKNPDDYASTHCVNVGILSVALGHSLGLGRGALTNLGVGGLLHDVGDSSIPAEVLAKPGRLDEDEWRLLHRHPLEGLKTMFRTPGLSKLMIDVMSVAFYHHVRYAGGGYPSRARSEPVPPMVRIVSAADCYDAMTTRRTYRERPMTGYEALGTLLGSEPGVFDPAVLWALVQTVGLYPSGTLLRTRSGHVVMSLGCDRSDPRRPRCAVLAYPDGTHPPEGQPDIWEHMPPRDGVARVIPPEEFDRNVEIEPLLAG